MPLRTRLLVLVLAATGLVLSAPRDGEMEADLGADAVVLAPTGSPIEGAMANYRGEVLALLRTKDFTALEEGAQSAREGKHRFANGIWKLHQFYTAFAPDEADPDPVWERRLAQMREWIAFRPQSPTPRIALAEIYTAFAWKARKGTPDSADNPAFRERLETGLAVLEDAREAGSHDPHYWRAAHAIAAGLAWPGERLDELYEQAASIEPLYWCNEVARLSRLMARHGTSVESIEAFAAAAAVRSDEYAEQIYAWAAWEASKVSGGILGDMPFEWERVQAGYRALLQRFPNSTALISQYCMLACRARDKEAARKCFVKLAGKADLRVFKSQHEYARHLRWANWN